MRDTLVPLGVTLAVQLLVSMAVVTVPVLAPAAAGEVGISAGYVGLLVAVIYGASMVSSIVAGALVRRLGAIRVSQFALASCAAGLALTAAGAPLAIVAGAVLLGFGYGPVTPASSHILSKSTPANRRSLVFSLKQTGVPLGGALAGALVPPLVLWGGWRSAALVVGAACLATMALAQPIRASLDGDREPSRPIALSGLAASLRFTLADRGLRSLAVCSLFFASVQLCLVTYLVTHLTRNLGFTLVQAGLMLTVAQAGGVVARILWGAIADRSGRPMLLLALVALGMGASAAATAAFTASSPALAIALTCAAFGATAIGWNGVFLAEVARLAPRGRAAEATGGVLVFTYFGVMVGPPAFAFLVEGGTSYAASYVIVAVPAVLCGLWMLWHEIRGQAGPRDTQERP